MFNDALPQEFSDKRAGPAASASVGQADPPPSSTLPLRDPRETSLTSKCSGSSKTFEWPGNPKFKKAYPGTCPAESFLLHVTDEMLTATGLTNKTKQPRFNAPGMKRLRLFCQAKGLVRTRGATVAERDKEKDSSDDDKEADHAVGIASNRHERDTEDSSEGWCTPGSGR